MPAAKPLCVKKVNCYQTKRGEQAARGQHKAEDANPVADQGGNPLGTRGLMPSHEEGSKLMLKEGLQPVTSLSVSQGTADTRQRPAVLHRLT